MKSNRRRGFTLIELSVVIVVLALLAAMVVPNLARQQESREEAKFYEDIRRLAVDAHTSAIREGRTVTLRYEENQRQFVATTAADDRRDERTVGRASSPPEVRVQTFRVAGRESNAAEWQLRFYADGRAEQGGLEFGRGTGVRSVSIDAQGDIAIRNEALPDDQIWEAGNLEQRQ